MRFSSEGSGEQYQPNEFMPPAGAETTGDGGSFQVENAEETLITPGAAAEAGQGGFAMPAEEQYDDPFGLRANATSGEQQVADTAGEAAMVESVPKYVRLIPPEQPEATAAPAAEGETPKDTAPPFDYSDYTQRLTAMEKSPEMQHVIRKYVDSAIAGAAVERGIAEVDSGLSDEEFYTAAAGMTAEDIVTRADAHMRKLFPAKSKIERELLIDRIRTVLGVREKWPAVKWPAAE